MNQKSPPRPSGIRPIRFEEPQLDWADTLITILPFVQCFLAGMVLMRLLIKAGVF